MASALASTSIRLATEYGKAIVDREHRVAPAVHALDRAETDEEREAAAGELLAAVAVADEAYKRRVDRILVHMVSTDQEHVPAERS